MATATPPLEQNAQEASFDPAANLWECARQYVHRREKMSWNINGQEAKPTFLDLFQIHIDGDLGGIGDSDGSRNHGADEEIDVDIFELREGTWGTIQLRTVGQLHEYLLNETNAKERVFAVNNTKSGVVGLLGAQFRLDPEFFSNQLSYMIPDYQRLPSILKNATYFTFRYARSDEQSNWRRHQLSVSTTIDQTGCMNTFVLMTDHGVKVSPCIAYKVFEEPVEDGRDYWSLKEVFEAQITYQPLAEGQTPAYTPLFAVVYTALAVAISELMFVLATREKVATQMLNGLNIVQFASTAAVRTEFITMMRELATGVGQPGVPEGLNLIQDCAELALKQFADSVNLFSEAEHEKEKVDETTQDLRAVVEYASRVITKHALVNERCAQVFGPGGFPTTEQMQDGSAQAAGEAQTEGSGEREPEQGVQRTETAPPPYAQEDGPAPAPQS